MPLGFDALQRRQGYPRLCGKTFLNQTKIFLSNETQYLFIGSYEKDVHPFL